MEVKLSKNQVEIHRVEVRDGDVRGYTLNDLPMTRRRTFDTWSVPGMFSTIERDVENVELVASGKAGPYTPRLTLWGIFHEQYGFPERYRRIQWGSDMEVSWEVTEFRVVER